MIRTRFTVHPTPVGEALLLRSDDGLVGLELLHDPLGAVLERWARRLAAASEPDDEGFEQARTELDEYFEGARTVFGLALDWRLTRGFTRDALQTVVGIPYGETAGYGEVALLAGYPRAARAVGTACATTPFSIVVPVHRVVRADGSIGEYGGHPEVKRFLLDLEAQAVAGV